MDLLTACVVLLGVVHTVTGDKRCPKRCPLYPCNTVSHGDACFQFVGVEKSWAEAESDCTKVGTRPVTIQTKETMDFIKKTLDTGVKWTKNGVWSGGHWENNAWVGGDGQPLSYTNWADGEPGGLILRGECVVLRKKDAWKWNDYPCAGGFRYNYICQYSASIEDEDNVDIKVKIGVGVAVAVLLIIVVVVLICIFRRKRSQNLQETTEFEEVGTKAQNRDTSCVEENEDKKCTDEYEPGDKPKEEKATNNYGQNVSGNDKHNLEENEPEKAYSSREKLNDFQQMEYTNKSGGKKATAPEAEKQSLYPELGENDLSK